MSGLMRYYSRNAKRIHIPHTPRKRNKAPPGWGTKKRLMK